MLYCNAIPANVSVFFTKCLIWRPSSARCSAEILSVLDLPWVEVVAVALMFGYKFLVPLADELIVVVVVEVGDGMPAQLKSTRRPSGVEEMAGGDVDTAGCFELEIDVIGWEDVGSSVSTSFLYSDKLREACLS